MLMVRLVSIPLMQHASAVLGGTWCRSRFQAHRATPNNPAGLCKQTLAIAIVLGKGQQYCQSSSQYTPCNPSSYLIKEKVAANVGDHEHKACAIAAIVSQPGPEGKLCWKTEKSQRPRIPTSPSFKMPQTSPSTSFRQGPCETQTRNQGCKAFNGGTLRGASGACLYYLYRYTYIYIYVYIYICHIHI